MVLGEMSNELALLKQGVELGAKSTDNAIATLGAQIGRLEIKIDAITTSQAEPGATAAGRQLLEKIANHEKAIAEHDAKIDAFQTFQTSIMSGLKTLRIQMTVGGLILGILSGGLGVAAFVAGH